MLKERLFTVAEVAEYLSISEQTLRRWINEGTLTAIKLGRELRIAESDLQAFLEARRTTGEGEEK